MVGPELLLVVVEDEQRVGPVRLLDHPREVTRPATASKHRPDDPHDHPTVVPGMPVRCGKASAGKLLQRFRAVRA